MASSAEIAACSRLMALPRPKVKVCGLTRREDIAAALDAGADYIGLIIYEKSPRAISLSEVADLLEFIPRGKRVLVDVSTPTEVLAEYRSLPFDFFQMHFDLNVSIATLAAWSGLVGRRRIWMAPRIPPDESLFPQIVMEFGDTFLVDSHATDKFGGTGKTGDWQRFLDWSTLYQHKEWILAGGLGPHNVADAIRLCQPAVIDVNSAVESAPGIKDHGRIRELFEAVVRVTSESAS